MTDTESESGDRRPPYPSLWCGEHDRWEPTGSACPSAFDPDEVDWLEPEGV